MTDMGLRRQAAAIVLGLTIGVLRWSPESGLVAPGVQAQDPSLVTPQPASLTTEPQPPPPPPTHTPTCVAPTPQRNQEPVRRFIFINGWDRDDLVQSRVPWVDLPKVQETTQWQQIRAALVAEAARRGESLSDDNFHNFSYRGEYENCDSRQGPVYSARDTRFRADVLFSRTPDDDDRRLYDQRAEHISNILRAFPDDRFSIIGHSLGGAVALYWAGTASSELVGRVDFVATLGSPLGGQPGFCFQGHKNLTPWLPGQVHDAIVRSAERTRVITIRNSHDSVVKPEAASIFSSQDIVASTVWRDLKTWLAGSIDQKGDLVRDWDFLPEHCAASGHTELATSRQVIQVVTDAAFPGTMVSLDGRAIAGMESLDLGPADRPQPFDLVIRWPTGTDVVRRLQSGRTEDLQVRVDGVLATVTEVKDLLLVDNVPELLADPQYQILKAHSKPLQGYHRFSLRVRPPPLPAAGVKSLSVKVGAEEDSADAAIMYQSPAGSRAESGSQTVLVIDASGSMADADVSGGSKIEAARRAALRLSRMIANESMQGGEQNLVGLVSFSSRGTLLQPFTADLQETESSIGRLQPGASTNMSDGLRLALETLAEAPERGRRTVVLLSDGLPNETVDSSYTLDPRQEVRDVYIPRLRTSADCVYVVGLGEPSNGGGVLGFLGLGSSIDEAFLQEVAAAKPECGGYYAATDAGQLTASFLRSRHLSTGGELVVDEVDKPIAQGETSAAVAMEVPAGSGDLNLTLDWPGSQLDLLLTDPRGNVVRPGYPDAELFTDAPPVQAIVRKPVAGRWSVQVYGRDIPTGQTRYSLIGSVRAGEPGPGSSGLPLLMLIGLGLGVLYFVMPTNADRSGAAQFGKLRLHGPHGARDIAVWRSSTTIGRAGCDVSLSDPRISREHARIRSEGGRVFIEDLNSANGTWVNSQRIREVTVLHHGDRLRFGKVEAEWRQDESV